VTATSGLDYLNQVATLNFPPGEVIAAYHVPIIDDSDVEDPNTCCLFSTNSSMPE